jgi:hypothetical protein
MIASDRVAVGEAWGFQHLLHPLFRLIGESVLAFRVLRLVGYAVTSVLLVLAARHVTRTAGVALPRHTWWFVLLVAQAGTLLAWSYPPRYLGYNEISAWLSQLLCASVVVGLLGRTSGAPVLRVWLPWAAAGAMIPPLLMAKFTAGVAWVPLVLLATLLAPSVRSALGRTAVTLLGAGLSALALVASGMPLVGTVSRSWTMLSDPAAQEASDHSVSEVLRTYRDSAVDTALAALVPVALLVVLAVVVRRMRPGSGLLARAGALVLPALLGGWLLALPLTSWTKLGTTATVMGVGGAAVLLVAGAAARDGRPSPARLYGLALVVVTPVVAGVGTNNAILGQTIFAATIWAVLLGAALAGLAGTGPRVAVHRRAPLLTGALLVWVMVTHVWSDSVVHPYRSDPLQHQTARTTEPALAGIRLTPDQADLATWLHATAEREQAADVPAVAINAPGHLFAFNRSGWASPWRGGIWAASIEESCRTARPDDLVVLDPGDDSATTAEGREQLTRALTGCGYAFPDDFRAVDEFAGSVVWRLR